MSRKREVLAIPNRAVRDPRFEALSGPLDEENVRKNYSFLDEYREDEMKQLREKIKKTKDEDVKGMLKRELLSMVCTTYTTPKSHFPRSLNPTSKTDMNFPSSLPQQESRKKAQETKDKQQEILKEHRAKEKELIKQGKKPYYLKKGDHLSIIFSLAPFFKIRHPFETHNKLIITDTRKTAEQKRLLLIDRFANLKGKQVDRVIERKRRKNAAKEKRDMPRSRRGVV